MKNTLKIFGILSIWVGISIPHSQAATHSIALSANVPGTCSISSVNNQSGFNGSTTSFSAEIVNSKATSKIGQLTINYSCTSQAVAINISSSNDGITGPAGGQSGTTNKIHYTAKIMTSGGFLLANLDTSAAGNSAATNSATVGQTPTSGTLTFELAILPTAGSLVLVASSSYSDTLAINIDPGA